MRFHVRPSLYFAALAVAVTGCSKRQDAAASAPVELTVMVARHHVVEITEDLPGRVSAVRIASIRPQVNGVIVKRLFEQGANVAVGQQLYQIDPAPYQAAYDHGAADLKHGEAELLSAQAKSARFAQLSKINAISKQDYDDAIAAKAEAEADIASAHAEMDAAQVNLTYTRVLSPIAGRIGRTLFTEGALLTANQPAPLTTITQLDPIYVDLEATGATLVRLKHAMGVDGGHARAGAGSLALVLEDLSTYTQPGRLDFAEVIIDESTGMAALRTSFRNQTAMLLPGMYVHARLGLGQEDAVLVPQSAVMRDIHEDPFVMIVNKDGRLERRSIQIDRNSGNNWIVKDGLADGDRVVTDGLSSAVPGAAAHITQSSPTPES